MDIYAHWSTSVETYRPDPPFQNFGDQLNPFIFKLLGVNLVFSSTPELYGIGSVLGNLPINYSGYIWTSGCLFPDVILKPLLPPIAVRGKLTLKQFDPSVDYSGKSKLGAKLPRDLSSTILGDGALVLPRFYPRKNPQLRKYKLGVFPHYVDFVYTKKEGKPIENYPIFQSRDVLLIDPRMPPTQSVEKILEQLWSCECVIVSCLHGAIVCDAYNIPNAVFCTDHSQRIIFKGAQQGFKFRDYMSVYDLPFNGPGLFLSKDTTAKECIDACSNYTVRPGLEQIQDRLKKSLETVLEKCRIGVFPAYK